jgi:hypothetical protein
MISSVGAITGLKVVCTRLYLDCHRVMPRNGGSLACNAGALRSVHAEWAVLLVQAIGNAACRLQRPRMVVEMLSASDPQHRLRPESVRRTHISTLHTE